MIIAVDVFYGENRAKAVGVLFPRWEDSAPAQIITAYTLDPLAYEPGLFYRRELPCIQRLLEQVDLEGIEAIVIDGYVYLDYEKKPGLGHYVYAACGGEVPVVGVAKSVFHGNGAFAEKVCRGESARPLYVTAVGMDLAVAAGHIRSMHGAYRFPTLLKLLDAKTREGWEDGAPSTQ